MASKRRVLRELTRDELLGAVDEYDLTPEDRRVNDDLVDAIASAKRARLRSILSDLPRDRLKEICAGLGLEEGGREKSLLVDRICGTEDQGESAPAEDDLQPEVAVNLLQQLLGRSLKVKASIGGWPVAAVLGLKDGQQIPVDLYPRVISGSSRGNPLERRLQNPASKTPIRPPISCYALLLGLWNEQGSDRAVVVAFDAYRRIGKETRFSMFMPLALLEQAADTGFATHVTSSGETIFGFRADNVERYLEAFVASGTWAEHDPGPSGFRRDQGGNLRPIEQAIGSDSINIRPRVGMYAAFARLNYKPWFALAEFVDNSVQSFLNNREALKARGFGDALVVDVRLDEDELSVTDRAGGIAFSEFPRAFSPAAPPADASGLSEFGLGMKAAACWFARSWSVRTSALGEAVERTVNFDVADISRSNIEVLPIQTRDLREDDHFTVVTMKGLRVPLRGRTLGKIKDHLASIYRVLIKEGVLRIRLTSGEKTEELRHESPDLLVAPYYRSPESPPLLWRREINVDLYDRKVTGWAGVMKVGSFARAGFSVFRRQRLIEGSFEETYKPKAIFRSPNSFASQRIVGELFVEGFDVSHTKDGIQWHGRDDEIMEAIRAQLDTPEMPLLDQANGYRARRTAASLPAGFGAEALNGVEDSLVRPATSDALRVQVDESMTDDSVEEPSAPEAILQNRGLRISIPGRRPWDIRLELVRDSAAPWFVSNCERGAESDAVTIRVNLEHTFSTTYINDNERALEPLLRVVTAVSLAEHIAREQGVKNAGTVRRQANELLRTALTDAPITPTE